MAEQARPATPGRQALDDLRFELKQGDAWEQHLSSRIEDGLDTQTEAWHAYLRALDSNPVVLAWARAKVLEVTGRWRELAARMAADDMEAGAEKWRRVAQIAENALVGGKTDDLAAFDARHEAEEGTGGIQG